MAIRKVTLNRKRGGTGSQNTRPHTKRPFLSFVSQNEWCHFPKKGDFCAKKPSSRLSERDMTKKIRIED